MLVSNLPEGKELQSLSINNTGGMFWKEGTEPSGELKSKEMASELGGPCELAEGARQQTHQPGGWRDFNSEAVSLPAG